MRATIERIVARGIRRPAYEADVETEEDLLARFEALGMRDVRGEPVEVVRWEERSASLVVTGPAGSLEHVAAASVVDVAGELVALDAPENRWWFVTEDPGLQATVGEAIRAENLGRSLVFKPDAFMAHPPTDGGPLHLAGVPLVNFLPAPRYLFDAADTPAMVHGPSLEPVTRAVARIVAATAGKEPGAYRPGTS